MAALTAYRFWSACFSIRRNASDLRFNWKDFFRALLRRISPAPEQR
jgi:hypothetical protein